MFFFSSLTRIFQGFCLIMAFAVLCSCGGSEPSFADRASTEGDARNGVSSPAIEEHLFRQIDVSVENGYGIDPDMPTDNIELSSIHYGYFTQSETRELLAIFRFMSPPHAAGMERSIAAIFEEDTLTLITQRLFAADNVEFYLMPTYSGRSRIFWIGETVYHGKATQQIELLSLADGTWEEIPIPIPGWEVESRCTLVGGCDLLVFQQSHDWPPDAPELTITNFLVWDEIGTFQVHPGLR